MNLLHRDLLCIASIFGFGFDLENIKKGIDEYDDESNDLADQICTLITNKNLIDYAVFENQLNYMINIDYVYNNFFVPLTQNIVKCNLNLNSMPKVINYLIFRLSFMKALVMI